MAVPSTKAFYAQIAAGNLLAIAIAAEWGEEPDQSPAAGHARPARRHAGRRSRPAPPSPRPPTSGARPGATGRSSATAPTASPPRSCGSSSPSSATSRSPATPPRTRSTSTCPRSRSSSCAPPASPGPTSTTWPRRWRSTGRTRRPRSSSPPRARPASPPRSPCSRCPRPTRRSPSSSPRWSATCSATRPRWPSTPRPCRSRRSGAASRPRSRVARSTASACSPSCAHRRHRPRAVLLRRPPRRSLRRAPRGLDGGPHRPTCSATRAAPCRSTPTSSTTARSAPRRCWSRTSPLRSPGPSTSSPGRSTPSSTRPRPSPSASPAPTSRLLEVPLVREVLAAGAPRDRLTYRNLRTLADVSPAVEEVVGYTRYRIEGTVDDTSGAGATITVVDRGGIARDLPLRTEQNPVLRGTKHQVAADQSAAGRARAQRRSHDRHRPGGQGRHHHRHHAAARPLRRAPLGRHRSGRARRVPPTPGRPARRGHRDRADLPRRPPRRGPGHRPAHAADQPAGRPVAVLTAVGREPCVVGVGIDLVDVDRFRVSLAAHAVDARADVHRGRAGLRRDGERPDRALRRPLRGEGGGDEGDGRRPRGVRLPRRRGAARRRRPTVAAGRSAPPSCSRSSAAWPAWQISLTHTATSAGARGRPRPGAAGAQRGSRSGR